MNFPETKTHSTNFFPFFTRIFIFLAIFGGVFGVAGKTEAATINAASCEQADVQQAVNIAASGDTVAVPAGTCEWGATINLPLEKTIKLIGAGYNKTIITKAGSMIFSYGAGNRISGFRFNLTGSSESQTIIEIKNTGFAVYNNYFDNQTVDPDTQLPVSQVAVTANGSNVSMEPEGVVYNNILNECRFLSMGEGSYSFNPSHSSNTVWGLPNNFGTNTAGWVYFEDNTIIKTTISNSMDANTAGRYVFRYNNVNGTNVMAHSIQGTLMRSTKAWEVYGNNFALGYGFSAIGFMRGGTGMIFGNYASFYSDYYRNNGAIALDNVRSNGCNNGACGDNPPPATDVSGNCDGTSLWDGNTPGQKGWPCRDQIGRGPDIGIDSSIIGKASSSEPAYFFTNIKDNGGVITASVATSGDNLMHIQADRDYFDYNTSFNGTSGVGCGILSSRPTTCTTGVGYWATNQSCTDLSGMVGANPATPISGTLYKCTATNTWTEYYTPYIYPHPLRNESSDSVAPSAPTGLGVL